MLSLALSPCPNDTYLIHAWNKKNSEWPLKLSFADVEQLNRWSLQKRFPVTKISLALLGALKKDYTLLSSGCALGFSCGPKIISSNITTLKDLSACRIAIPGRYTTAHLLFDLFAPKPKEKIFCAYHEIASLLKKGIVDCGLIIHESRFTFAKDGFFEVADLGSLWEERYSLPLPLGGFVARNDLSKEVKKRLISNFQSSLEDIRRDPLQAFSFIQSYSQEKAPDIIQEHIKLYVNAETYSLSKEGQKAIDILLKVAENKNFYCGLL